jgi:hypothetical protein
METAAGAVHTPASVARTTLRRPLVGWREWRIVAQRSGDAKRLYLSSFSPATLWPAGEPMVARHSVVLGPAASFFVRDLSTADTGPQQAPDTMPQKIYTIHPCMVPACTCGIHAFKELGQLADHMDMVLTLTRHGILDHGDLLCYGAVSLWGTVCEHEYGYRAQFAYPRPPLVVMGPPEKTGPAALELSKTYGLEFRAPWGPAEAMLILTEGKTMEDHWKQGESDAAG